LPRARLVLIVHAPTETLWATITDFDRYADYQPELRDIEVLQRGEQSWRVAFTVMLIKRIRYVLDFEAASPNVLRWSLVESNFLTSNSGQWTLKADDDLTRARYDLEIEVGRFVPRAIITKLVDVSLPRMLERFKQRAVASWEETAPTGRKR